MTDTDRVELVFITVAAAGHIVSTVELAKLLIDRDERLSITILPMKSAILNFSNYGTNHSNIPSSRIRFIHLPDHEPDPSLDPRKNFTSMIEDNKLHVKEIASKLSPKLAGIVLDLMCTPMIDVAIELGVPSYLYYAAGAAFLGMMFHVQDLHDEQGKEPTEFDELVVPGMANPLPVPKSLPSPLLYKEGIQTVLNMARKFRETKGIIINTFTELEPYAVNSLASEDGIPPVYPVGPLLNLKGNGHNELSSNKFKEVMQWLDDQPPSSVVFLCFGSMGSFDVEQVKEIAYALENSGHRFLWSLRRPPMEEEKHRIGSPTEYSDHQEVLPDGFLDRTADAGRVIGWAPQVEVLGHPSVGGFVSHCGWNSVLEAIWHGVPIGAWPLYAEQQFNAFELVVELGLAVEFRLGYRSSDQHHKAVIVNAGDIERGIRSLMDRSEEERMKLLDVMREYSKRALEEDGSSYNTIGCLIQDIIGTNNH
ncbi:hypothetical protein Tsubulata_007162 [Turnera subulata]|uniref:Glycosyltransferase n=1 Tax=Turnera subulata TaxID=218843 RepID=A0A9Q0FAY9_9ROSI|nr:hypothetical protein Tsubulata_007162 [Turnera subulata]